MKKWSKFYINGRWVEPASDAVIAVSNPATGQLAGEVPGAIVEEVDLAVAAARGAFDSWSTTPISERVVLLQKVFELLQTHASELAGIITEEMGAPVSLSEPVHIGLGLGVLADYIEIGKSWDEKPPEIIGNSEIYHEAIGVCSLITPWNYPLHQIVAKLAPALLAGCIVILKPSSETPLSAYYFAELLEKAGIPDGVFNLLSGSGRTVGERMCVHPEVDMVSITGSTSAGARVAELAAAGIKRVSQELGGKSACILLEDAPIEKAVPHVVMSLMSNTGQTCAALTRLLVPRSLHDQVAELAGTTANSVSWGDPSSEDTYMGPQVSISQRDVVRSYIEKGIQEGARLVCGGTELPEALKLGAYVAPTVFANVSNDMVIAREEIFGPVLTIVPYDSEDQAVQIANDNDYGLSGSVWSESKDKARAVARRIKTGQVMINDGGFNFSAPFGGYKKSGNGRELGRYGLEEFLEVKALNF